MTTRIEIDPQIGKCPPKFHPHLRTAWYVNFRQPFEELAKIHNPRDIAKAYECSSDTLYRWAKQGVPKGQRTHPVKECFAKPAPEPKPVPTRDQFLDKYFRMVSAAENEPNDERRNAMRIAYLPVLERARTAPTVAVIGGCDDDDV